VWFYKKEKNAQRKYYFVPKDHTNLVKYTK